MHGSQVEPAWSQELCGAMGNLAGGGGGSLPMHAWLPPLHGSSWLPCRGARVSHVGGAIHSHGGCTCRGPGTMGAREGQVERGKPFIFSSYRTAREHQTCSHMSFNCSAAGLR